MKNLFTYICIACVIVGAAVGYFSTIPLVDGLAISAASFGLTGLIVSTTKKAEKLTWKEYLMVAMFTVAGVCAYIANVSQEFIGKLAAAVVGLLALIFGVIVIKNKSNVPENT